MPVTPVPAATVILVRSAEPSPEVLMVERSVKSEFMPDLYVFPGGRVEDADHDLADRVRALTPEQAGVLAPSVLADQALGFFVAAIRETWEESGILLARRRGESALIDAPTVERLDSRRLGIQGGEISFRELVEAEDLELAADRLAVHAHWVTPERVPRRFDTLFFTAEAPPGQRAAHDGVESTAHVWIRPEDALEQGQRGERQMVFPTRSNLETISGFGSVDEILDASHARPVVRILPWVEKTEAGAVLKIDPAAGYPTSSEPIRT